MLRKERILRKFFKPYLRRMTVAMLDVLIDSERRHKWNNEWLTADWQANFRGYLLKQVDKGNLLHVLNVAFFGYVRGWHSALPMEPTDQQRVQVLVAVGDGQQDFICELARWTDSGLPLRMFLRGEGVLGDDEFQDLSGIKDVRLEFWTRQRLAELPDYNG